MNMSGNHRHFRRFSWAALLAYALTILRVSQAYNEISLLRELHKAYPDWQPRGVIDVGANAGGWSRKAREAFPNAKIFMVEAFEQQDQGLRKVVQEIGGENIATHRIAVLSSRDGDTVKFYQSDTGFTTGNSMFQENSKHYAKAKFTERKTTKLDTLVAKATKPFSELSIYDYLRLDVQGAELMVLQGASNILSQVAFVQLEVSLVQYNQGGACWWQIDEVLRKCGFYLYDLSDFARNPEAFHSKGIGQMDVLYVRPTAPTLPRWLRDNKVNMCGSSTATTSSASLMMTSLNQDNNNVSLFMLLPTVTLTFLLGIFVGRQWPTTRKGMLPPMTADPSRVRQLRRVKK